MSNLLKVGTTISKSERIIDYNDIIKDRVEAARAAKRQKADSDGFINGLNADVVERLPEDEINTEAAASEEITQESAEAARAEAEEILAQAKAQAEEILAQAQAQAGQIREEAKKEGFNSGTIESERQLTEKNRNWNSSMHSWQDSWKKIMNSAETIWNHRLLKHCWQYLPK